MKLVTQPNPDTRPAIVKQRQHHGRQVGSGRMEVTNNYNKQGPSLTPEEQVVINALQELGGIAPKVARKLLSAIDEIAAEVRKEAGEDK